MIEEVSMKNYSFSSDGKELIIHNPQLERPWCNYISNENYGIKFSHTGGGFSVYPLLEGSRINKYGDNDQSGRYVYIKDRTNDEVWSLNWQPVKKALDYYHCRHGQGYSIIESGYNEIEHSLKVFALDNAPGELWIIKIKNASEKQRELSVYPYVEWFLGSGTALWDNPAWYTRTEFFTKQEMITATFFNPAQSDNNYEVFFKPFFKPDGFCCSKREFCGTGGLEKPNAMQTSLDCPLSHGEPGVGTFEKRLCLAPGESCELHLLLGYQESEAKRNLLIKKYNIPENINTEFEKISGFWNKIVNKNEISTPDTNFNRWINIWLKYQEYQCFRWAGLGEPNAPLMGFRDVLQHVLAMSLFYPQMARERIIEALSHQYNTGRAVRQWSRRGQHDRRDYRDSPVWIIFALCSYLKETGDFEILEEQVSYIDNGGKASVMEHAVKALDILYSERGKHGLCYIGEGDWYDPLNKIGTKGYGESVWLSMALIAALKEMTELYDYLNRKAEAEIYRERSDEISRCVNKHGWDGEWYLQAYTDDGEKIGSTNCEEGKIFANPQIWSVISGVATEKRQEKCYTNLEKHMKCGFGYPIVTPHYSLKNRNYGNVGILQAKHRAYSHVGAFKMLADCLRGDADTAMETFKLIDPTNPVHPPEETRADPHIIPNNYAGVNDDPQQAYIFHSGSSGAFPWILKVAIEYLLGAKAEYDGLRIFPCLPTKWNKAHIRREFRGCVYNIEINKQNTISAGKVSLIVDGKPQAGQVIKYFTDGKEHTVVCHINK